MASYNKTILLPDEVKDMINFNRSVFYDSMIHIHPKDDSLVNFFIAYLFCFYKNYIFHSETKTVGSFKKYRTCKSIFKRRNA